MTPPRVARARPDRARLASVLEAVLFEVKRVVVGQDEVVRDLLVCLLARGHCLLEGAPGLGKTLTVDTLARVSGMSFNRIQFTPDLVPSDVTGTRVYRASSERFDTELGPVFANVVLADEINRAPAKVQAALLEAMAERQVTIAGETHPLPRPFIVLATQNPLESEGVYPLPEAQQDRFLMKVVVGYPTLLDEIEIVRRATVEADGPEVVLNPTRLVQLQHAADAVYVDPAVVEYVVRLVLATREPARQGLGELAPLLAYGASPRASLGLVAAARALALIEGRGYALADDVLRCHRGVLRHRIGLSYEALASDVRPEDVLDRIVRAVPAPAYHAVD